VGTPIRSQRKAHRGNTLHTMHTHLCCTAEGYSIIVSLLQQSRLLCAALRAG
jgi:hypothetical protein